MSKFVDECRREWKRLGVPHSVAGEMAADLEADLEEAESEGASLEEVLGSGAFDPRSFAASWAGERGVITGPPVRGRVPTRPFMWAAIVVLATITAAGAVLVISSQRGQKVVSIPPVRAVACRAPYASPPPGSRPGVTVKGGEVPYPGPFGQVPVGAAPFPMCHAVPAGPPVASFVEVSGVSWYSIGWTLLSVGIVGIIAWMLLWRAWVGPILRARPLGHDERAAGDLDYSSL
jgi:hypothetical protein